MLMAESGDWDNIASGASARYEQKRFGANPPSALVELHKLASHGSLRGVRRFAVDFQPPAKAPPPAKDIAKHFSAPSRRWAGWWRPSFEGQVGRCNSISLTWDELRAADISGRARAFQSLVGAGMDLDRAAALSGLLACWRRMSE